MAIPVGYGRLSWVLSGGPLPTGARVTLGLDLTSYTDPFGGALAVIKDPCVELFRAVCVSSVRLTQLELKVGPDATGATYTEPVGVFGLGSGNAPPPNTAMLVRETSDDASGRLFGRMFWPGFDGANVSEGGVINNVEDYQDVFSAFQTDLSALGVYPCVLTSLPEGPRAVSAFQVQGRAATQRRRLRR